MTGKFERTKEGRVEYYYQKASRRIGQVELSRGWSAWLDLYEEKLYEKTLIRRTQSAFFCVNPTVPTAFAKWHVCALDNSLILPCMIDMAGP